MRAVVADPARKQAFVTSMFEHVAPRYDAFTRLFSFGMDARWKALLMEWLTERPPRGAAVLDIACGTGDIALATARSLPDATVHGLDAAAQMIDRARERAARRQCARVAFGVADLCEAPFPDASMDLVTAGYAYRNAPNLPAALAETARVLRPGGRLLVLDFYLPRHRLWRALFLRYLHVAGSIVGWAWHRSPAIYAYIAVSIEQYVSGEDFARALSTAGLDVQRARSFLGGGIMLHEAVRRA